MAEALDREFRDRFALAGLGFLAGLALWFFAESQEMRFVTPALYLTCFSFTGFFCTVSLALAGPLSLARAAAGGLLVAVPLTVLIRLASLRFETATEFLDHPALLAAAFLAAFLATPFVLAALRTGSRWNDYGLLFAGAWGLTVRYVAGFAFAAVFWLLVFLSDALLSLVQVGVIEWVLEAEWLVFALTGGVLGLALAVAYELRTALPPDIPLRLLRLLALPVLVVVAVFLVAVPLRGLGEVFGALSAAGTLLAVALVMITLISVVLDRGDAQMEASRLVRRCARVQAVLLPLVSGLAAWAIGQRVAQYGWTPDRVLAACAGGALLGYGLLYAGAALRRTGWEARIRAVNTWMPLAAILLCAAVLSPVLDPGRISAQSQMSRFLDGRLAAEDLPLWELGHEWGRPGQAVLARLEEMSTAEGSPLAAQLDALRGADSRWEYQSSQEPARMASMAAELVERMPVVPAGSGLSPEDLDGLAEFQLNELLGGCRRLLPGGEPGCIMVAGQFRPDGGAEGIILHRLPGGQKGLQASHLILARGGEAELRGALPDGSGGPLPLSLIGELSAGRYGIGAPSLNALTVGSTEILPWP
jgi:hypothetical protein